MIDTSRRTRSWPFPVRTSPSPGWSKTPSCSAGGKPTGPGLSPLLDRVDRSRGTVIWKIDDAVLHVAAGLTGLPDEVHLGFGIFTLVPLGEGESSNHGQGARASWRNFEYNLSA